MCALSTSKMVSKNVVCARKVYIGQRKILFPELQAVFFMLASSAMCEAGCVHLFNLFFNFLSIQYVLFGNQNSIVMDLMCASVLCLQKSHYRRGMCSGKICKHHRHDVLVLPKSKHWKIMRVLLRLYYKV
jgi:hypothetical protein